MTTARAADPLRYRPEIDGLRCIAVLGVVAYHAAPGLAPGGFTGVDVFFVISGFLITRLILDRDAEGRFSFTAFYAARIRRIVPALAAMLAGVGLAAVWLLPPADLELFGQTLMGTAGFFSNLLFAAQSGYFDPPAASNLLLHAWSLSVEEQFYLIVPVGLILLARSLPRRWTPGVLLAVAMASLAWAEWYMSTGAEAAAFYLLQARLWELMLGGALASARLSPPRSAQGRDGVAALGLALIAGGMALAGSVPFPGLSALAPCLGAALVIHGTSGGGRVAAWLGRPALVGVGLISYSLYLWHWPLLTVPRLVLVRPLTPIEITVAVALAFALAWLSWRYVERPFRHVSSPGARTRALVAGSAVLMMLVGAGALLAGSGGLPERASPAVLAAEAATGRIASVAPGCHVEDGAIPPAAHCTSGPGAADVLLWGDSHALHLLPVVTAWAEARGLNLRQATKSGCLPLLAGRQSDPLSLACRDFNAAVAASTDKPLRAVILGGRWLQPTLSPGLEGDMAATVAALRRRFGPRTLIVLVAPGPEFGFAPSLCFARTAFLGRDTGRCDRTPLRDAAGAGDIARMFDAVAATDPRVTVLRPGTAFCDDVCRTRDGDRFFFRDDNHLTAEGARRLAPLLSAALDARLEADREARS